MSSFVMSPCIKDAPGTLRRARAICRPEMSTPVTLKCRASRRVVGTPAPQPRSSTPAPAGRPSTSAGLVSQAVLRPRLDRLLGVQSTHPIVSLGDDLLWVLQPHSLAGAYTAPPALKSQGHLRHGLWLQTAIIPQPDRPNCPALCGTGAVPQRRAFASVSTSRSLRPTISSSPGPRPNE